MNKLTIVMIVSGSVFIIALILKLISNYYLSTLDNVHVVNGEKVIIVESTKYDENNQVVYK